MVKNKICFLQCGNVEIVEGSGKPYFPYHTHNSFIIGVILKGNTLFSIKNREFYLGAGMTYVVPPNTGISITPITPYIYLTICIKDNLRKAFERYYFNDNLLFSVGHKICKLCDIFKKDRNINKFVRNLLLLIKSGATTSRINSNDHTYINEVKLYVEKHISEKITLDALSKGVHISKYHLLRSFKRNMGITPKQYILQEKLRRIKEDLFAGVLSRVGI